MLYASSLSIEEATKEVGNFVSRINEFMERYIRKRAKIQRVNTTFNILIMLLWFYKIIINSTVYINLPLNKTLKNLYSCVLQNDNNWRGTIDKIQEIEENFWCPELGVKGKVDVSVQVGESVMPLELKTGRATVSLEHRGQVILYLLMMEKFGYNINSGLLLYLR